MAVATEEEKTTAKRFKSDEAATAIQAEMVRQLEEATRKPAQTASAPGTNAMMGWMLFAVTVFLYVADYFYLGFNGIDITIFTDFSIATILVKSGFLSLFLIFVFWQLIFSKVDLGDRKEMSSILLFSLVLANLFILSGRNTGALAHIGVILAIWVLLVRYRYDTTSGRNVISFLLFFDFLAFSLLELLFTSFGLPGMANLFGNRLILPILIVYTLLYLNRYEASDLAGILLYIIIVGFIFAAVGSAIYAQGFVSQISEEQKVEAAKHYLTGWEGFKESMISGPIDFISCSIESSTDVEGCTKSKLEARHPELKQEIEAKIDPKKDFTKISFGEAKYKQEIERTSPSPIFAQLKIQSPIKSVQIEISCKIERKSDKKTYEGVAYPSVLENVMTESGKTREEPLTCDIAEGYETTGEYTAVFSAIIKDVRTVSTLDRLFISGEMLDTEKNKLYTDPYSYSREAPSKVGDDLAAFTFGIGGIDGTKLLLEGASKTNPSQGDRQLIIGNIENRASGKIIDVKSIEIDLSTGLSPEKGDIIPDAKSIANFDYEPADKTMSMKTDKKPTIYVLEKILKGGKLNKLTGFLEIPPALRDKLNNIQAIPIMFESSMIYDYLLDDKVDFKVVGEPVVT